jgi:integrase
MKTWVGRVRGYPEGSARGRWLSLGTDDREMAQKRYDAWLATGEPPREANEETFQQAAERIVDDMPETNDRERRKKTDRRTRLRSYAYPVLGQVSVWAIEPSHVCSVLDSMPALGKLKGTILKMRSDISKILGKLQREGAIRINFARNLALPDSAVEDGRLRQVLTDGECVRFREKRGYETELDMACLVCRDLAGHRTSDILASRYEHIVWKTRTWKVRRPKTDAEGQLVTDRRIKSYELVEHEIPDHVYGPLRAWWKKHGSPESGPVFPVRRPGRGGTVQLKDGRTYERRSSQVGDAKSGTGTSYCKAFRKALWGAGIYRPLPGWDPSKPQKKFCALQTDTKESRRADFHSVRRAFVTALKAAGVETADVLALAGHTNLATSSRYDAARRVVVPDAAIPGRAETEPEGPDTDALLEQLEAMKALLSGSKRGKAGGGHGSKPAVRPTTRVKNHSHDDRLDS